MAKLLLDTSTDHVLIALIQQEQPIRCSRFFAHGQNLSKSLLPSIQELFAEENLQPEIDLDKIFVGIGPGSYTGTRIAVAVAQNLALALSCPLHSFCSLLAFLPSNLPQGPFAFLFPSTHSNCFLLKGSIEEGIIQSHIHLLLPKEEIAPFLEGIPFLLSFNPDQVKQNLGHFLPHTPHLLMAEPNLRAILPYLSDLEKHPPNHPEIIYLHHF